VRGVVALVLLRVVLAKDREKPAVRLQIALVCCEVEVEVLVDYWALDYVLTKRSAGTL